MWRVRLEIDDNENDDVLLMLSSEVEMASEDLFWDVNNKWVYEFSLSSEIGLVHVCGNVVSLFPWLAFSPICLFLSVAANALFQFHTKKKLETFKLQNFKFSVVSKVTITSMTQSIPPDRLAYEYLCFGHLLFHALILTTSRTKVQ